MVVRANVVMMTVSLITKRGRSSHEKAHKLHIHTSIKSEIVVMIISRMTSDDENQKAAPLTGHRPRWTPKKDFHTKHVSQSRLEITTSDTLKRAINHDTAGIPNILV